MSELVGSAPVGIEPLQVAKDRSRAGFGGLRTTVLPRSLRGRLVLVVFAIYAMTAIVTGAVIMLKARTATRLEIASSMQLAEALVADTVRLVQDASAPVRLESIDLHFKQLRHVRISLVDANGRPVETHVDSMSAWSTADTPTWFARLVSPAVEEKSFPVVVQGRTVGAVGIRSDPDDEVGEAWNYVCALLVTLLLLTIGTLAVIFLLFGRMLAPLSRLGSGLRKIESRNYDVRLEPPSLRELAAITDLFNRMAANLNMAQAANRALHRQLLTAQDDERRRTALELHDEAGPCLFALEANATSIVNITKANADARLRERAEDVVALVGRVQEINRRVLDRLRPIALGQLPLQETIERLVFGFDTAEDIPDIDIRIGTLRAGYGRVIDLTIYRCIQEGVTNALRHAQASTITVTLAERHPAAESVVALSIEDDGLGFRQPLVPGFGLAGMRERVEALGGRFDLRSAPTGTRIAVDIPLLSEDVTDPASAAPAPTFAS